MTNPKGTQAETAVVNWLRLNGFPGADRLTKTGARDRGDVGLCPGVIAEVKNHLVSGKRGPSPLLLEGWMQETVAEQANAFAEFGILIVKREGTTDVGRWWAFMRMCDFAQLLPGTDPRSRPHGEAYCKPVSVAVADLVVLLRLYGYGHGSSR